MGEIIEISIASAERAIYDDLLDFMKRFTKINSDDFELLRIDDWNYSNETRLKSLSEIENWIDTKIICYTVKDEKGSIGLYIEKEGEVFTYDIWFNPKKQITIDQYADFKEEAVSFLKTLQFDLACIGREISVDYAEGYEKAVEIGKGIEYIIVSKKVEEQYGITKVINQKKNRPELLVLQE